jgi:hypothetical protein
MFFRLFIVSTLVCATVDQLHQAITQQMPISYFLATAYAAAAVSIMWRFRYRCSGEKSVVS